MIGTFKRTALGLSLVLALAACGAQTPGSVTVPEARATPPSPSTFQGFTVDRSPDLVARRVSLPAQTVMPAPLKRLSGQSLSGQNLSSLPAWTGPRLFDSTPFQPEVATNSRGELFVALRALAMPGVPGQPSQFSKFSSTGQGIGSSTFTPASYLYFHGNVGNNWLVVTEGRPQQETYDIITNADGKLEAQIYSDTAAVLNGATEPILPMTFPNQAYYGVNPVTTEIKASNDGIVMSSAKYDQAGGYFVPVYEAGYEPWREIGLRISNVIRPPRAYKNYSTTSDFAVGSDGSVYLAVFTSYVKNCRGDRELCPSVAGITRFTGEDVAWQVYWDADEPIRLKDVAVSDGAVSLLVYSGEPGDPLYAARPTRAALLNFSLDGAPIGNTALPRLTSPSYDPLPQGIKIDAGGKLLAYNADNVLTGTQAGGLTRAMSLSAEYDGSGGSRILDASFSGDYLYVSGVTGTGLGTPTNPPPRSPYGHMSATDPRGSFVLPLDFSLKRRF